MDSNSPEPLGSTGDPLIVHTGYMHIPVTAAPKHGPTYEIAETIAHRLEDAGHSIDVVVPAAVESVDSYDVIVYGLAVYVLQWMDKARSFLERFAEQLKTKCVWALSVRVNGVPKHTPRDPTRIGPALMHVLATDKHASTGRYKPPLLSLREHSVTRLAGVVEGDLRDWSEVEAWADSIAVEFSDKD